MDNARAAELVLSGECSGSCLVAAGEEKSNCRCHCQGRYHGDLADAVVMRIEFGFGQWSQGVLDELCPIVRSRQALETAYRDARRPGSNQIAVACAWRAGTGLYTVNARLAKKPWLFLEDSHHFTDLLMGLARLKRISVARHQMVGFATNDELLCFRLRGRREAQALGALFVEVAHGNRDGLATAVDGMRTAVRDPVSRDRGA